MKKDNILDNLGSTGQAYMNFIEVLSEESVLDEKVHHLAYLSVLAAVGLNDGIDYHIKSLIELKTTKDEIRSAILVAMPVVGMRVAPILKHALYVFEEYQQNK